MSNCISESEMMNVALSVLNKAISVDCNSVYTAQDAMINLRIDWEELQSRLKNRKLEGFEPVIISMIDLAATSIAVAATLQAKIKSQYLAQLNKDNSEEDDDIHIKSTDKPITKAKKKAKLGKC